MEHNFLGKADSSWDNQELFHILCAPQVHYRVRKSTSLAIQATLLRPSFKLPAIPDDPSGPSSSNCSTKILRVFLISPTHFTCHAHLLISADHAAARYAMSGSLAVLSAVPYCDKARSRRLMRSELLCLRWSPQYSVCDLCHVFPLLQVLFLVWALRNIRRSVSLWHQVTAPGTFTVLVLTCCTLEQHCKQQ